eukprot:GHVT01100712.1.p1 GENE.GHVT01100712.1~~GHVT01100712.1.p1  ORF type:complete len:367 (+),score=96.54 GHVT01100712.1:195-1295(+)
MKQPKKKTSGGRPPSPSSSSSSSSSRPPRKNRKEATKKPPVPKRLKKLPPKRRKDHAPKPAASSSSPCWPIQVSGVRNKEQRQRLVGEAHAQHMSEKKEKRLERQRRRAAGLPVEEREQRTIEKLRTPDESIVAAGDAEVEGEDEADEFAAHFGGQVAPKLLVTTSSHPSSKFYDFLKEWMLIMPNSFYYKRGHCPLKSIVGYAAKRGFTAVLVFAESKVHRPNGLYVCHLPEGPSCFFRLSSVRLASEIFGSANLTSHTPELLMNNFDTRMGRRVGRLLAALFPLQAELCGRRVVTFHNQRDFVFFRQHRYVFKKEGKKCSLQEIGPRFTMKLRWLHAGTFNTKQAQYEFVWKPDLQIDRKTFFV